MKYSSNRLGLHLLAALLITIITSANILALNLPYFTSDQIAVVITVNGEAECVCSAFLDSSDSLPNDHTIHITTKSDVATKELRGTSVLFKTIPGGCETKPGEPQLHRATFYVLALDDWSGEGSVMLTMTQANIGTFHKIDLTQKPWRVGKVEPCQSDHEHTDKLIYLEQSTPHATKFVFPEEEHCPLVQALRSTVSKQAKTITNKHQLTINTELVKPKNALYLKDGWPNLAEAKSIIPNELLIPTFIYFSQPGPLDNIELISTPNGTRKKITALPFLLTHIDILPDDCGKHTILLTTLITAPPFRHPACRFKNDPSRSCL